VSTQPEGRVESAEANPPLWARPWFIFLVALGVAPGRRPVSGRRPAESRARPLGFRLGDRPHCTLARLRARLWLAVLWLDGPDRVDGSGVPHSGHGGIQGFRNSFLGIRLRHPLAQLPFAALTCFPLHFIARTPFGKGASREFKYLSQGKASAE
jgi:hypothetical protein